jgi:hypothetical protein
VIDEEVTGPGEGLQDDGVNASEFESNRAGTKEMRYLESRSGEGLCSSNIR